MRYASKHKEKSMPMSTLLLFVLTVVLVVALGVLVLYFTILNRDVPSQEQLAAPATGPSVPAAQQTEAPTAALSFAVTANQDPDSISCKSSYTAAPSADAAGAVVAKAGDKTLTNAQLQILYLSEVSAYRAAGHEQAPDFSQPLDTQQCPLSEIPLSWQHYFLEKAIHGWQLQQAILYAASQPQIIKEEAFKPNATSDLHGTRITPDLPVNDFLYADRPCYKPNKLHQAWLDGLEQELGSQASEHGFSSLSDYVSTVFGPQADPQTLLQAATDYNTSYMYFTQVSFDISVSDEQIDDYLRQHSVQAPGHTVDIRHVLLVPEGAAIDDDGKVTVTEAQWNSCEKRAESTLKSWREDLQTKRDSRSNFARLANRSSQDAGSQLNGGYYYHISPGQLTEALDKWCFDASRKEGDIAILRSDVGVHIIYLQSINENDREAARQALLLEKEREVWSTHMAALPLKPDYSAVALWADCTADSFSLEDVLYPDVAHERFPEAIVYLQQDYFYYPFGSVQIGKNGCGITTFAMLATYMTDTLCTPAMMADRFPNYQVSNATDGNIFRFAPAELGFYQVDGPADLEDAIAALKNGQRVINLQRLGHFTRAGHYLLLQAYNEENDTFQIRDSNIYNYGRLDGHKVDYFTRANILSGSQNFYIMQRKITRIPACVRCGGTFDDRGPARLVHDYSCEKCAAALSRRNNFLTIMADV